MVQSSTPTSGQPSVALVASRLPIAIAVIILADALVSLVVPVVAVLAAARGGGALQWFQEGGAAMYLLVLLAVGQCAANLVLGLVQLKKPVPLVVHLTLPVLVMLVGVGGKALGLIQAGAALAAVAPDMRSQLWAMANAEAGVPLAFASAIAAIGCLQLIVNGSMMLFVRLPVSPKGPTSSAGTAVAAAGLIATGFALAYRGMTGTAFSQSPGDLVLAVIVFVGALVMALAAPSVAALAARETPDGHAVAVEGLLLAAIGLLAAVVLAGSTMAALAMRSGLSAMATAAPDVRIPIVVQAALEVRSLTTATIVFALAALVVVAVLALPTGEAWGRWATQRGGSAMAAAGLVLAVGAVHFLVGQRLGNHKQVVVDDHPLPGSLRLPASTTATPLYDSPPLAVVQGRGLLIDGDLIAEPLSPQGREELVVRLPHEKETTTAEVRPHAKPALEARRVSQRTDDGLSEETKERLREKFANLFAAPRVPCGGLSDVVRLAAPANLPATDLFELSRRLGEVGVCKAHLIVDRKGSGEQDGRSRQQAVLAAIGDVGILDDLVREELNRPASQLVWLIDPGEAGEVDVPALGLTLTVDRRTLTLSGRGGTLEPIPPTAGDTLDAARLEKMLDGIRNTFPDANTLSLSAEPGTTVQDLVAAIDAVYGGSASEGRRWPTTLSLVAPPNEPYHGPIGEMVSPAELEPTTGRLKALAGVTVAEAMVGTGSLPKEVIKKVVVEHRNQIRYCYEVELQKKPDLAGRVVTRFTIGPTGAVSEVAVAETTLNNRAVEQCMVQKIKSWAFPRPAGGGIVQVSYPWIFKAE